MGTARQRRTSAEKTKELRRLRRFLSPHVFDLIRRASDEELLAFHRREITVVFCDLRGFTAFAQTAPSPVIIDVLGAYHRSVGPVIARFDGILERFTGDGLMIYFDEAPLGEQAARAVRMAVSMRDVLGSLSAGWRRRGHQLSIGIGIALGEATLGPIGFEQRLDYAAVGPVTNLAFRLCAEAAGGEVLVSDRLYGAVRPIVEGERLGPRWLKGFSAPVEVYKVRAVNDATDETPARRRALEYVEAKR